MMNYSEDIPKYKKKSTAKGQSRSKHKHIYETVLLTKCYHGTDFKTGKPKDTYTSLPTKVCTICGRIDGVSDDSIFYIINNLDVPYAYSKELSEEAKKLPKWHCDFFDKFAIKDED